MSNYFLRVWLAYPQLTNHLPPPLPRVAVDDWWQIGMGWPDLRLGVEMLPTYLTRDGSELPKDIETICKQHNAALLAGWQVFWLTPALLNAHPFGCIEMVAKAVAGSLTHAH